jgi:hypothetical protein
MVRPRDRFSLFEDDGFTALPAAKAGPRMNAAAP